MVEKKKEKPKENEFVLFWLDGKKQNVNGENVGNAIKNAGYGIDDLQKLDFFSNKEDEIDFLWNDSNNKWEATPEAMQREINELKKI